MKFVEVEIKVVNFASDAIAMLEGGGEASGPEI